ncbi:MAG: rRNA maturation RNase YbeY [Balneolaceae bacterium]|nr:MAG: rRNA maturation RNase YbeY [Balneolaceae bacterium]
MKPFPEIPLSSEGAVLTVTNTSGISVPVKSAILRKLASLIEEQENLLFQHIEVVFVNENDIIDINREYLSRDYVTDIITFRYDENGNNQAIEGTLFCCAQRIGEQSAEFGTAKKSEFYRVYIHGLLHLAGYDDQLPEQKEKMTKLEDYYLEQMMNLL